MRRLREERISTHIFAEFVSRALPSLPNSLLATFHIIIMSRSGFRRSASTKKYASMERLYEDEFVMLTPVKLVLKNFRFPNKKCKIISIEQVGIVWFENQDTCKPKSIKTWGKCGGTSCIYWALDVKRCLSGSHMNVVVDIGSSMRFGFTVEDGTAFMEAMRDILDYHVIIVDKINI